MIPAFHKFFPYVLKVIGDNVTRTNKDIRKETQILMKLSDEEVEQLLESGNQSIFHNRSNWAITYLYRAGLLNRISTGTYKLSFLGENVI